MSDDWKHYFASIADHTASILFDDGISEQISSLGLQYAVKIELDLREWNENGLTTNDEADRLNVLEKEIESKIEASGGILLGRVTSNRKRWVMGLSKMGDAELSSSLSRLITNAGYEPNVSLKPDPEKLIYWQDLYPTPDDRQVIGDMSVLRSLSEHGDNHEVERTVFHWAYFKKKSAAAQFQEWANANGFSDVEIEKEGLLKPTFRVTSTHIGTMHLNDITKRTLAQFRKASELGGKYDGWETSVEKNS